VFQRRIRITKFQGFAGESKKQSSHSHCMPVSQSVVLNVALGRFLVFQRSVVVFSVFCCFLLSFFAFMGTVSGFDNSTLLHNAS